MSWNYRVVKRSFEHQLESEFYYEVVEMYYDEKGNPHSSSESHNLLESVEGISELKEILKRIEEGLKKPVLEWEKEQRKYVEVKEDDN